MDLTDTVFALGGFIGGLLTSLLKAVFPAYLEIAKENRELRKECADLRDEIVGLEDALRDCGGVHPHG